MVNFQRKLMTSLAMAFFLCACSEESPPVDQTKAAPDTPPATNGCPVTESKDWQAWVNAMPGPGEPKLNITGNVTFSKPGITALFSLGPLDRRMPPSQRIIMTAVKSAETLEATQTLSASLPALAKSYRSIIIVCGDDVLASITDVEIAQ